MESEANIFPNENKKAKGFEPKQNFGNNQICENDRKWLKP